ncbi:hypothetical protein Tco_0379342 [Tanacetum coccineum]
MMCFPLSSSHCLLLSHLLLTYQDTLYTPIQRRIRRMKDPEEDPTDYPADGGDDDDDDDESSDDDKDDDDYVEDDEDEEEEEHPASADFVPPPIHRVTARMSIRDEPTTPFWSEVETARLLVIPSPPPSPLSPLSSPLPQIPSPQLPVSSPVRVSPPPLHASPTYPLGYRAAMILLRAESPSTSHPLPLPPPIVLSHTRASVAMMRAVAPSTYILAPRSGIVPSETPPSGTPPLLPIPAPTSLPLCCYPLLTIEQTCPRFVYHLGRGYVLLLVLATRSERARMLLLLDRLEVLRQTMILLPLWIGRLGEIQRDVGYGITDTWDEMLEGIPGVPATDKTELGRRMTNFVTMVRQDTDEIYGRLDEAQEARAVLSDRLNLLGRDRRAHAHIDLLMEREARLSREAWGRSMDTSDTAHSEVRALRTTVLAQQIEIATLRAADRARQA